MPGHLGLVDRHRQQHEGEALDRRREQEICTVLRQRARREQSPNRRRVSRDAHRRRRPHAAPCSTDGGRGGHDGGGVGAGAREREQVFDAPLRAHGVQVALAPRLEKTAQLPRRRLGAIGLRLRCELRELGEQPEHPLRAVGGGGAAPPQLLEMLKA